MSKSIKSVLLTCIFLCLLFILSSPFTAYAATTDTAATLQELQDKVGAAMESRATSYSVIYTNSVAFTQSDITNMFNNILSADDYLHFVLKTYGGYTASGTLGNITVNFTFTYWETAAQTAAVDAKVTQVLESLGTSSMNDYQKEKAIHDWIITNVAYDTTLAQHSAYAAITSPYKTVCQGYALLAYNMFKKAGLQTRIIEGSGNGEAHVWNLVNIDGNWYNIDMTWDDPVPDVAGRVVYNYYNLTDSQIKANHTWTGTYPAANTEFSDVLFDKLSSDSYNAIVYQGLIDDLGLKCLTASYTGSTISDIGTIVQQAVQNQQTEVTFRYLNKNTLSTDLKTALTNLGNITSYSYSVSDYVRTTTLGDVIVNLKFTSTVPINVTSVSLSQSTLSLTLGGATATLIPTITPSNASNKSVIWTTSDATVATVTNGIVKAVGGGTATITATTIDGSKTASCTVTVTTRVIGVSTDKSTISLKVGDPDVKLNAVISPASATVKDVIWTSSNSNVATVASDGTVHAVAIGTATITVTTADGAKTAKCVVTVPTPVSAVTISPAALTIMLGQTPVTIKTIITPSTASIKTVTWKSSDETVAKVSATGTLTPVGAGTATITATTTDGGLTATSTVTVIQRVTGVTLNNKTLTIKPGGSDVQLTPTIAPSNATIKDITWTSSNPNVATVDSSGVVHAVACGTAVIKATSKQDSTKYASCTVTVPVVATGVKLSKSSILLKMGMTATLVPVISPSNAVNKAVTWTSSDSSVATVGTTGIVKPIGPGTAIITATTVDGNFTANCTVDVIYAVTGVTLDKKTLTIKLGSSDVQLTPIFAPSNATIKDITWTSSNPKVATVDSNGVVHAAAFGTAVIKATSKQDSTKYASCTVTVPIVATGVKLSKSSILLKMGMTATLVPTISPSNAVNKSVIWTSSDSSVATVSATGVVKPIGPGTAIITATTVDGNFTANCTVDVIYAVTGVTLDKKTLTIKPGSDVKLTPIFAPSNATIKDLTWTSSNPNVATVDSNGVVHAIACGTAVIKATSKQDSTKYASCTVTVPIVATGVKLSKSSILLKMGVTATLVPTISPSNAANKSVIWTSSNSSVATVSATGVVKPIGPGTAIITATTVDGNFTANCTVDVIYAVTGVTLDKKTLTIKPGGSDVQLTPIFAPSNATIKDVTWTSNNPNVATVDSNGVVHAVAYGTAVIKATSKQDSTKYASCTVAVTAP